MFCKLSDLQLSDCSSVVTRPEWCQGAHKNWNDNHGLLASTRSLTRSVLLLVSAWKMQFSIIFSSIRNGAFQSKAEVIPRYKSVWRSGFYLFKNYQIRALRLEDTPVSFVLMYWDLELSRKIYHVITNIIATRFLCNISGAQLLHNFYQYFWSIIRQDIK